MEWTGERIIPKLLKPTNGMLLEHIARYYFATPYIRGRVLDLACGTGYGCHLVAKERKREVTEIVGVDIDPKTLAYANVEYNHQKIKYMQGSAIDPHLPEQLGMFDTILSFETIEHVEDDFVFMENLYQMLRPGGTLVLSSPFGRGRGMPTSEPFHVHQLTPQEFEELFARFSDVEIYYQRGVTFEKPRDGVRYFIGVAVCSKSKREIVIMKNGQNRKDIHPGLEVEIVLKKDQRTGKRTRGIVKDILTSSPVHTRGIKVRLQDGQVGRVQAILE